MCREMFEFLKEVERDPAVRRVVFCDLGENFIAGGNFRGKQHGNDELIRTHTCPSRCRTGRDFDPAAGKEPLDLMVDAVREAAHDASAKSLLQAVTSVRVIYGMWPYKNPARAVADRLGMSQVETALTPIGGHRVQAVVNQTALELCRGQHDVVIITGAECGRSQAKAGKAGIELNWSILPGTPDRIIGTPTAYRSDAESARGMSLALEFYPLFENALRYHGGRSIPEHQRYISELWERFSRVAVDNPHAWLRKPFTAEEIRTPSPTNRSVTFPYPKLMNSNNRVDQGSALILCSLETARRHGVPEDRLVFPHVGTAANDYLCVSNRDNLHSSPAIRIAGKRALELAEIDADELDFVDVYSCFPSAVQVAAAELGLSIEDTLTVTGGLTFAGGPHNNYVMHSIATMAECLRKQPGTKGLVTANGGYLSMHAFGVYSTQPPEHGFQHADLQAEVNRRPGREAAIGFDGEVTTESYSVVYGDLGPRVGHVTCLTSDGRRTWATATDQQVLAAMTQEEFCGKRARIDTAGEIEFL